MSIYSLMKKDWETYCLMSAVAYIEEMSKPTERIQIKKYKNKTYRCLCFHSIKLKMNDQEFINYFFKITKYWENKKSIILLGKRQKKPYKEKQSHQDQIFFSPIWINYVMSQIGKIPNKYSRNTAVKRINHLKQYKKIPFDTNRFLLNKLLRNKTLAAGAFILSMDLEFRGIQSGRLSLCMSKKYKDFLEFMLKIAKKWEWTNNKELSRVSVRNNIKKGIRASPQFELRINSKGLQEIYNLAGPLKNSYKERCIKFHVNRSKNYVNKGANNKKNKSKGKILNYLKKNPFSSTTELQFITNTGTDVVLIHLKDLEKENKVIKQRNGKRYLWKIK